MASRRWLLKLFPLFAGLIAVVVLVGLPAQANSAMPGVVSTSAGQQAVKSLNTPASPNMVLYDQYDHAAGTAIISQDYGPGHDELDVFVADDFIVPEGQKWSLNQVDVRGQNFNSPVDSFNVFIYNQQGTLPGSLVATRVDMTYNYNDPDFSIEVNPVIELETGSYWISVQANLEYDTDGTWLWNVRTTKTNNPAVWRNPGGGAGLGCTTWGTLFDCLGWGADQDMVFRINGSITFPSCGNPSNWVVRNPLPYSTYGSTVVSDGVYVYVIGGYDMGTSSDITETLRYNPQTNSIISMAAVPHPVMMASGVYVPASNKIYVFGGENQITAEIYDTTLIYDIASNTWTNGASMPDKRAFMAHGTYNGKEYLVGGYNSGSVIPSFSQVWEYDFTTDLWDTKASMPEGLGGAGYGVVNGHLYVVGGRDDVNYARNQTYDYDIAADSWSVQASLPYGVNVPGSAVLEGKIWVIGGGDPFLGESLSSIPSGLNLPNAMGNTIIYDPESNSWIPGPSLNISRSFIGATSIGNFAFAIGGFDGNLSSNAIEVMGPCWSYLPVMISAPTR